MTVTLLVLASIAAANPMRAAAASPPRQRAPIAFIAAGATLVAVAGTAAASGPLLEAIDVTGPSARIAAGVALVAVCLKDLFAAAPAPQPALTGIWAGLVPLAFPVIFSPALALVAVAGASDRGVEVAVAATIPAVALVAGAVACPPARGLQAWIAALAVSGIGIAVLVTLDGVYAI